MKVILTTNIKKIGNVGDQVIVKSGYARNYLFPNKMALRNTKTNLEYFENIKDDINLKENEKKQKSMDMVEKIKKIDIIFTKEADDKDQLYGAISKKEIISYLNKNEVKILSDDIKMPNSIRTLGNHIIEVNPYEGIFTELKITVNKT